MDIVSLFSSSIFMITLAFLALVSLGLGQKEGFSAQVALITQSTLNATDIGGSVRVMRLDSFPRHQIALHFPCAESNMFATNCACHIRCRGRGCSDAVALCEKYKISHGCRYVLLRGGVHNPIATLKRVPTAVEARRLNLADYPSSIRELDLSRQVPGRLSKSLAMGASDRWSGLYSKAKRKRAASGIGPVLGDLVKTSGPTGAELVATLAGFYSGKASTLPHCPRQDPSTRVNTNNSTWKGIFLSSSISLVAVSYQAPRTLLNTMRSWRASGLLDLVAERIAILSDPFPQDLAIAAEHGFRIVEPKDISGSLMSKPNTLTIGAAFYYALKEASSEYVLFLENDFKMDETLPTSRTAAELLAAAGLLDRGIELVRLLSRKHQGCGTFKSCNHGGIHLDAENMMERRRNWFAFYCPADTADHANLEKHMSRCLQPSASFQSHDFPEFRCFTSWDSNWSLNAVLVKRRSMLEKKYPTGNGAPQARGGSSPGSRGSGGGGDEYKSIAEIGLEQHTANDGFESTMSYGVRWMRWKVPLCISYDGLFLHEEIETGA